MTGTELIDQRGSAVEAETRIRWQFGAARGACHRQLCATVQAETGLFRIIRLTLGTVHRDAIRWIVEWKW